MCIIGACARATRYRLFTSARQLVMGGGAMYGIMYIGVLAALCNGDEAAFAAWRSQLRACAGTSAGALVATLVAAQLSLADMRHMVHDVGLGCIIGDLGRGLMPADAAGAHDAIATALQRLVERLTGNAHTTLNDFVRTTTRGTRVVFVVTNGTTGLTEYWSNGRRRGNVPLWLALRATMAVPALFQAPVLNGNTMFDGGLTCNIPCHLFPAASTLTLFVHARPPCAASSPLLSTPTASAVPTAPPSSPPPQQQPATQQPVPLAHPSPPPPAPAPAPPQVTNPLLLLQQLASLYSAAAQLGPLRSVPLYALRSVPCVPSAATQAAMGRLGAFRFDAPAAALDSLIADGARCTMAVIGRDGALAALLLRGVALLAARHRQRHSPAAAQWQSHPTLPA